MSEWKIVLTPESEQEIRDIYAYIANALLVPETAKKQVARILDGIGSLDEMPMRFSLTDREPWRSRGLRKFAVDNYVVFYYPNEQKKEVVIFHVFYGARDIDNLLKK